MRRFLNANREREGLSQIVKQLLHIPIANMSIFANISNYVEGASAANAL